MSVGDSVQVRIVGRYQDQNIHNTLWYQVVTEATTKHEVLDDLVQAWVTNLKAVWLDVHIDAYKLIGVKAFGHKDSDLPVPGKQLINEFGTVPGTPAPSTYCGTITLYTDDPNHRRRGRVMLSGRSQEMMDETDGGLNGDAVTLMDNLSLVLRSGNISSGDSEFKLVVHSPDDTKDDLDVVFAAAQRTPASVRTRRIREFSIG